MSKMDKSYEIYIDSFTFFVNVTGYWHQPAQGPSADSDWDCWGYEEIEWEITKIIGCDENGLEWYVGTEEIDISEYSEYIEDKLLELIRELKEDDFDYPEPDYYDY